MNPHKIASLSIETWVTTDPKEISETLNFIVKRADGWRILGGLMLDDQLMMSLEISPNQSYEYVASVTPDCTPESVSALIVQRYFAEYRLVCGFTYRGTVFSIFERPIAS